VSSPKFVPPFRLRYNRGTYFVGMVGDVPRVDGTYLEAATFGTREEAARQYSLHRVLGHCVIEDGNGRHVNP
jgi:hypothetical protein